MDRRARAEPMLQAPDEPAPRSPWARPGPAAGSLDARAYRPETPVSRTKTAARRPRSWAPRRPVHVRSRALRPEKHRAGIPGQESLAVRRSGSTRIGCAWP